MKLSILKTEQCVLDVAELRKWIDDFIASKPMSFFTKESESYSKDGRALLTFINSYNVHLATRFNDTFTITKIVALVIIILTGLVWLLLGQNLPRAIYISLPTVTLVYMFVNIAYFSVLSVDEVRFYIDIFTVCNLLWGFFRLLFNVYTRYSINFIFNFRNGQLPEMLSMISVNYLTPMPSLLFLGS
uniref:SSD domain-containing protein n=1 Tax=Heterorhabditis bacteriophora TaxID=37862 RepID=A0A1I7XIB0_HETBA